MKFFDAHNHLNNELFSDTWPVVLNEANKAGVVGMIVNGGDLQSSERALEQAQLHEGVYVAAGIHPEDLPLKQSLEPQLQRLHELANEDKVVAIGELGLDYTLEADKLSQFDLIEPQLALAEDIGLPVVLHVRDVPGSRDCFEDMLGLMKNFSSLNAQWHCWTGDVGQMERVVAEGHYVSFSGILTYGSAGLLTEAAREVPADRMLIETDGPFLIPEPKRSQMRKLGLRNNERLCLPEYVIMTAEKLAELRQVSVEVIAEQTMTNAKKLFKIE